MRKLFLAAVLLFGFTVQSPALISDSIRSAAQWSDNGDSVMPFAVSVNTTSATLLYNVNVVAGQRDVRVCNAGGSYTLALGTSSAVNFSTASARIVVPQNWCEPLQPNTSWYAIWDVSSGGTRTVTGHLRYQSGQQ